MTFIIPAIDGIRCEPAASGSYNHQHHWPPRYAPAVNVHFYGGCPLIPGLSGLLLAHPASRIPPRPGDAIGRYTCNMDTHMINSQLMASRCIPQPTNWLTSAPSQATRWCPMCTCTQLSKYSKQMCTNEPITGLFSGATQGCTNALYVLVVSCLSIWNNCAQTNALTDCLVVLTWEYTEVLCVMEVHILSIWPLLCWLVSGCSCRLQWI